MHLCACGVSFDTAFKLDLHRDGCIAWRPGGLLDPEGFQTCKACLARKPLSEYHDHPNQKVGKAKKCKDCISSRSKKYRESNRDKLIEKQKQAYWEDVEKSRKQANESYYRNREKNLTRARDKSKNPARKAYLSNYAKENSKTLSSISKHRRSKLSARIIYFLGGRCSCGEENLELLTIDHILLDGRKERKNRGGGRWKQDILDGKSDLSRYRVQCHSCNVGSYRVNSIWQKKNKPLIGRLKRCSCCLLEKDESEFHRWKENTPFYECGSCRSFRNWTAVIRCQGLLGGKCACCSEATPFKLTIDHVRNNGGVRRLMGDGSGSSLCRRILKGVLSTSDYQLLCWNCNYSKHRGNGLCVHGRPPPVVEPPQELSIVGRKGFVVSHYDQIPFRFDDISISRTAERSRPFFDEFHYAGFGRYATVVYIAYLNDVIVAAAKFCYPVRTEVASSLGYQNSRVLELDRFCIHPAYQQKNFGSWFLSRIVKLVANDYANLLALVSFADTRFGHQGTLYKASGWKHVSSTSESYIYSGSSGEVHKKTVWNRAKRLGLNERELAEKLSLTRIVTPSKRKFIYIIRQAHEVSVHEVV